MYQVFCNNKLIIDSRIDELAVVNPIVDIGVNIAGSFVCTFPSGHPFINEISRLTSVVRVERDKEIIFQGFCSADSFDIFGSRKITCEGDLSYLNDSILRPQKYTNMSVQDLLTYYIQQHNAQVEVRKQFDVGDVTVTSSNAIYCYTNMNSTLSQIKEDLVDDLGGYIRVRYEDGHRYIDYLASATRLATQTIELGKNIVDYSSNINESELATRVIPLGAQLEDQVIEGLDTRLDIKTVNSGLDYLESQSAINNFGIITKTVIFDDVTTASRLKTRGQLWLNDAQFEKTVISIKALDLGLFTNRYNRFKLLDSVHVISPKHGMDRWFPLTSVRYNLNSPEKDTLTLGQTIVKSLTAKTTQTSVKVDKTAESINESVWLNRAKQEATALINGVDGGAVVMHTDSQDRPYEILVMDTDDINTATKVWRWNQNGFGYSSNGYAGPYGTAITMNGKIVADYISTGTLRSVEIANGGTSVSNAPFKVSTTGAVTASNIAVTGGSILIKNNNVEKFKVTNIGNVTIGGSLAIDGDGHIYLRGPVDDAYLEVIQDWNSNEHDTLFFWEGVLRLEYDGLGSASSVQISSDGSIFGKTLSISGSKNRIVDTPHYGKILLNAYETPRPTFADEGHGTLDNEGICYIDLDDVFVETIDLTHDYRVFLTKYGEGDIWVKEVTPYSIIVRGTPNLGFDWKIDCIQRDYNLTNMEPYEDTKRERDIDYTMLADEYLKEFNFEEVVA